MASPLTVRLDEKTRQRITRIARRRGVSRSEFVRQAIEAWAERQEPAGSLYEAMADLIGVVNGGDPTRSSDIGKKFAKHLRNRRRNA